MDNSTQAIAGASTPGQAAGLWWANTMKSPSFDNGANDIANLMAQFLAKDLANSQSQDDAALETFAKLISEHVDSDSPKQGKPWGFIGELE